MRRLLSAILAILLPVTVVFADLEEKVADRLWQSAKVINELTAAPEGGLPKSLMKRAECIAVIPGVKKIALGFGGRYGRGALSCRKDQGQGAWGPPSMLALSGGSFGIQFGGQSIDLVMLFMSADSIKYLLRDKVTLGGDVAVAVGPLGREASAETSASLNAEILTYSRSRGLFAGVSLKGASLRPDREANESLYGKFVRAGDLLVKSAMDVPTAAQQFIVSLTAATAN